MINKMDHKTAIGLRQGQTCRESTYQKRHLRRLEFLLMLNNIASDLDLLLSDLCHIYPYPVSDRKFTTFGKGQTFTDVSPGFGEDSAFGTLASTDSYSIEQKPRSDSVQSAHLDVFSLDHSPKTLEIPSYPDNGSDPLSDSDHRPINFLERLSKTHPIWFLPEIGRSGSVHLLKDREIGTFIIRNSSQPDTYALSAQFPTQSGANVDHYLIENTTNGFRVQGSSHIFSDITKLVAFYHENLQELPHRLVLPPTIRRAKTLQELTSLSYLGQDFWTSYRFDKGSNLSLSFQGSNNSLMTPPRSDPQCLHKSKSEPINITNAKHFKKKKLGVSLSTQHFKEHISSQSDESLSGCDTNVHQKSSSVTFHSNHDGAGASSPRVHHSTSSSKINPSDSKDYICEMCQSNIHMSNKQSDDNWSSGNSSDDFTSRTHPRPAAKQKSNLYFTTSLDLLNIPENQYFKSNLSDKMSDYEDVWRSSTCATPISSVNGKTKHKKCKRSCPYPNMSEKSTSPTLLNNAISLMRMDVPNKIHTSIQNNLHTDAGVQTAHSGSIKQNLRKSVSLDIHNTQNKLGESFKSEKTVQATCATQTSPVKVISKPKPLNKIDDKVSCASSSSKSGVKSPVYAEPFDALADHQSEHVNIVRIRRRSAPSMGLSGRKLKGVSQGPTLETILSPGHESQEKYDFDESDLTSGANENDAIIRRHLMRRSHSMQERSSKNAESEVKVLDRESIKHVASELEKLHLSKHPNNNNLQTDYQYQEHSIFEECDDGNQEQVTPTLSRFPVYRPSIPDASRHSMFSELSTVEDLISSVNPQLTVKPLQQIPTIIYSGAMSEYDNLASHYAPASNRSNAGTEFCAPWDTTFCSSLLNSDPHSVPQMDLHSRILAWQQDNLHISHKEARDRSSFHSDSTLVGDSDDDVIDNPELIIEPPSTGSSLENLTDIENRSNPHQLDKKHVVTCRNRVEEQKNVDQGVVVGHHKKEKKKEDSPEYKIREYICRLSQDRNTTFGSTIENFIQCTLESQDTNPHHVTRNVRQFMTGIKNYLVKHGEGELDNIIQMERTNLNSNEIFNIDGIIEKALHVCVLRPLKHHIYRLFVEEYTKNGSLPSLSRNIKYARSKTPVEIGLRSGLSVPSTSQMDTIRFHLTKMQKAYSPLRKLEHLLQATQCIYQCFNNGNDDTVQGPVPVGADDFLPMLIYVVVHCGIVAAEIEADYMWDLINPAVMNTEGGYYLTSLNSAVLVLKNFRDMQETKNTQHESRLPSISDMQGFLKFAIPDELRDSIIWKTLPVRPNMNTRDVCSMIAHKFKITNPQDYGLYYLVKGIETRLKDSQSPQMLKADRLSQSQECIFAYKRTAANIAWPLSMKK